MRGNSRTNSNFNYLNGATGEMSKTFQRLIIRKASILTRQILDGDQTYGICTGFET